MNLETIQDLTDAYSTCRETLAGRVLALQDEMERVKRRHLPGIREAVGIAAAAHDELRAAIAEHPELFRKPKTRTFHVIRIGYMKQRGQVVIEDEEAVIKRIRAQLPHEQADLIIRVRESVHKPAVYDLTAADLKRLGITVTADEDVVVIKPVDGEIDKLINALLADAERVDAEEAA